MALDELNAFFSSAVLPDTITIADGVKIINVPDFIQGHLQALSSLGEEPVAQVFYERLLMIKDLLVNQIS